MALLLLRLPSSPHQSHLYPSFPKPSTTRILLPVSNSLQSSRNPNYRSRVRGTFPSIATLFSSSTAEAAVEEESAVEVGDGRGKRLIAQNIPWDCTAEDIRALFEKHGVVVDVELSMYNSNKNRGLAFVSMASEEEALAALENLNSTSLCGRIIKVELARSLKKQPPVATAPAPKYNVFVGNLSWRVRSRDLRELFNANGKVLSTEVIFQSNPRRSAGYGFASFSSKEEAEAAITAFNGKRFMGRPIRLILGKLQTDSTEVKSHASVQIDEISSEPSLAES
ncbi:28 kDa ribonucleoprotein, chloroplastic-like [Typha latifolia]|uniref:28 kDa ribonucleoprotein, chloroplastic-like n=1 Tax=Typha latifolia TaxID=4733 RepID=UPI003C2B6170